MVKSLYGIDNEVRMVKKEVVDESTGKIVKKTLWALTLGPDLLQELMKSYHSSMKRKRVNPVPTGDFPFKLGEYYSEELIRELIANGIEIREDILSAVERNRKGRIIILDTPALIHIFDEHDQDFADQYDLEKDIYTIGNFIFNAIKKYPIIHEYAGEGGRSKFYVYDIFGKQYLKVLVEEDGFIVTAFPSEYKN